MKKALLIIAPEKFRDEEYFQTKEVLEAAGIAVDTASRVKGDCSGKLGGTAVAGMTLAQVDPAGYDAVVFVGGGGAEVYIGDPLAHAIARKAYDSGRLVAAICIAPLILAAAGLLKGRRSTVFETDSAELVKSGAVYTGRDVEVDGRIVTGAGPFASRAFGEAIVKSLNS